MKIATVVGARPQFIKAAIVSESIRVENTEILIHTGQHYDNNMSDVFFEELGIPKPDYNLKIGSESHAKQTAHMMIGIEDVIIKEKPDFVMVYGDTNSTLAGALTASKLNIPVIHIEAGLRSFNRKMPEEQNRILTDHISEILFCPTETAVNNLKKENITNNVFNIGDVMCDAVLHYSGDMYDIIARNKLTEKITAFLQLENWYLATIHRAENTDSSEKIEKILNALQRLDEKVIFPVHPRIIKIVKNLNSARKYSNIIFIEPVGYIEMLYLTKNAKKVITDSGGLQKEAYILNTPCVTVRNQTEWIETLKGNLNVLSDLDTDKIINNVLNVTPDYTLKKNYYGLGEASQKICDILKK